VHYKTLGRKHPEKQRLDPPPPPTTGRIFALSARIVRAYCPADQQNPGGGKNLGQWRQNR
jgi:hypothetical protein